jgi:hypothetical protein
VLRLVGCSLIGGTSAIWLQTRADMEDRAAVRRALRVTTAQTGCSTCVLHVSSSFVSVRGLAFLLDVAALARRTGVWFAVVASPEATAMVDTLGVDGELILLGHNVSKIRA